MGELKDILLNFGAIAGFAGIVGLAVLAMLYFSQARDVRRLREWAGREPERAGEIELRAQQIASQAIAQAYESMAMRQSEAQAAAGIAQDEGVQVQSPLAAEAPPENAPVSEETQVHDVVQHEFGGEEAPAEDAADAVEAREQAGLEETDADGAAHGVAAESTGAGVGETAVHPAPDAADDTGDESDDAAEQPPATTTPAPNVLAPSTPAAARAASPLPPLPPLDTSEFQPASVTTPPIPDYYLTGEHTGTHNFEEIDPPSGRSRVPFAVAGVLVAVFAVILIATQLVGGDDDKKATTKTPAAQQPNTGAPKDVKVNRAAVTVSILNGTDTSGIAAIAADGLNTAGFTDTTVGNLNDGTVHPKSIVYYAEGNKPEAEEVANEMRITDVKPATEDLLAKGGSVPVIVVLGADFDQ